MFFLLMTLLSSVVSSPASAQETLVDYGSLNGIGVEDLDLCKKPYDPDFTSPTGHTIKMLGAAYVYMGPSNGLSILGHASERFIYCHDQNLIDNLFGYYKPEARDLDAATLKDEYGIDLSDYSEAEQAQWTKSLYVHSTLDPASTYAKEQIRINRNIFESWLNLDSSLMLQMLFANVDRYQEQKRRLVNHLPLPEYQVFANNCTSPVQEDLALVNPEFKVRHNPLFSMPKRLFRKMRRRVKRVILYPSQSELRWIQRKEKHQSNATQGFVPTSKIFKGAFPGSWVLIYDRKSRAFLKPVLGALNLVTAVSETAYGLMSAPFRKEHRLERFKAGIRDLTRSAPELVLIKVRYPQTTAWRPQEIEFLNGLKRKSALFELLNQH